MIAVMIQGGRGANNWRDHGAHRYESYVLEVQELIDRMLPTVAKRAGRAIAGDSMGGYGAMNVALDHPERFAVVESWLGFFNGLGDELRADRPVIARERPARRSSTAARPITSPIPPRTHRSRAELRAAGADAHSAVYPGRTQTRNVCTRTSPQHAAPRRQRARALGSAYAESPAAERALRRLSPLSAARELAGRGPARCERRRRRGLGPARGRWGRLAAGLAAQPV